MVESWIFIRMVLPGILSLKYYTLDALNDHLHPFPHNNTQNEAGDSYENHSYIKTTLTDTDI